jgi:general secretion pathway protein C
VTSRQPQRRGFGGTKVHGRVNHNRAMQKNATHTWSTRAVTFALATLAALSASYWFLKSSQGHSVSSAAVVAASGVAPLDPLAVARALGGGKVVPAADAGPVVESRTRFTLLGVLAGGRNGGAALISVDGKPAKPYPVGATVDGTLVVQSVAARRAALGAEPNGPAQITLELPTLSK